MNLKSTLLSLLAIVLIVSSVLCTPGCISGATTDETPSAQATPGAGVNPIPVGGTLRIASGFTTPTFDSAEKYAGWYTREFGIAETLYSIDFNMSLQPELATSYEQVSDTEYRFNLRQGVKFHDGTPFNADAVVFSFNRVLDKNNTRSGEYSFIESVTKTSDYVVTITTKYAYSPFVSSLTDPIMSIQSPNTKDFTNTVIGTGPFKFVNYQKDVSTTVARFDDYWGGKPNLDGVVFYYISDAMTRLMKLENGEVDIAFDLPQTEVKNLKNSVDLRVSNIATTRTYFLYINGNKAPYNDLKFRQALNYAINKDEICENALEGVAGKPANSIFPSVLSWSANDQITPYACDPAKAKSLLAEAGFSDINGDGYLEYKGQPFTISLKTYTSRPQLQPSSEVIVSELKEIGLNAKVEIETSSAIEADMNSLNYDLVLYAWNVAPTGDPDYIMYRFFAANSSEGKKIGYANDQLNSLVIQGRTTTDIAQRKAIYDQVQATVHNDTPVICVFYQGSIIGLSKNVGNFHHYPREIWTITPDVYLTA